jgi:hypothetical protein
MVESIRRTGGGGEKEAWGEAVAERLEAISTVEWED